MNNPDNSVEQGQPGGDDFFGDSEDVMKAGGGDSEYVSPNTGGSDTASSVQPKKSIPIKKIGLIAAAVIVAGVAAVIAMSPRSLPPVQPTVQTELPQHTPNQVVQNDAMGMPSSVSGGGQNQGNSPSLAAVELPASAASAPNQLQSLPAAQGGQIDSAAGNSTAAAHQTTVSNGDLAKAIAVLDARLSDIEKRQQKQSRAEEKTPRTKSSGLKAGINRETETNKTAQTAKSKKIVAAQNSPVTSVAPVGSPPDINPFKDYRVRGIIKGMAWLEIDGKLSEHGEGDALPNGATIRQIDAERYLVVTTKGILQ